MQSRISETGASKKISSKEVGWQRDKLIKRQMVGEANGRGGVVVSSK